MRKEAKTYLFFCVSVVCDEAKLFNMRSTDLFVLPRLHKTKQKFAVSIREPEPSQKEQKKKKHSKLPESVNAELIMRWLICFLGMHAQESLSKDDEGTSFRTKSI